MIRLLNRIVLSLSLLCLFANASRADTITFSSLQLSTSNVYYTDLIGGGIGSPLIMTGGGATANVGGSPNDDGFSGPIPLGFVLNLFGTDYTELWANNNGNVSFGGGFPAWLPGGLSSATVPIIAPFFADVDTTGVGSGLMYLRNDIPNEIIITWDQVGYYHQNADKLDSFQLVLRGPDFVSPTGEGQVGFFYKTMAWETGDASGGDGGFSFGPGGVPAAVGFGDGTGTNELLLDRSLQDGVSGVVSDHHVWFNQGPTAGLFEAAPVQAAPVPEPATFLLVGTGAAFLGRRLYSRRRQA